MQVQHEKTKNELLQQTLEANQRELASTTLYMVQKNELLAALKTQVAEIKKGDQGYQTGRAARDRITSNKEIAVLLNIAHDSVRRAKSRLFKKWALQIPLMKRQPPQTQGFKRLTGLLLFALCYYYFSNCSLIVMPGLYLPTPFNPPCLRLLLLLKNVYHG